jgi:hypothetical protein
LRHADTRDTITLDIACGTGRTHVSAQNFLQVLPQIVTHHCQQQCVKVNAAS